MKDNRTWWRKALCVKAILMNCRLGKTLIYYFPEDNDFRDQDFWDYAEEQIWAESQGLA